MASLQEIILDLSEQRGISDYAVKEGEPLWVRRDGMLERVTQQNVSRETIIQFLKQHEAATGVITSKLAAQLDDRGDLDFAIKLGSKRFRGNLYWSNNRMVSLVLRRLSDAPPPLKELGIPQSYLELLKQSKGLILVTGATGSGKTTTLAASLEHINNVRKGHIVTLEDPVEYALVSKQCLIDQRQIGRDTKSFAYGLRSALRQDPDVILVGELRDFDTVKTALDAANTGHLVFATLHTNSSQQSIERITSFFSADKRDWAHATLSQALLGVLSQVLVPRLSGGGRVLAAEMLVCTPDVKNSIREGRTHQIFNAMDTGTSRGHVLLNSSLRAMVRAGMISEEAAEFAAYDPPGLRKSLTNG